MYVTYQSCVEYHKGYRENTHSHDRDHVNLSEKITYSPDYCTQQGSHSNMKEKSKALQTSKS